MEQNLPVNEILTVSFEAFDNILTRYDSQSPRIYIEHSNLRYFGLPYCLSPDKHEFHYVLALSPEIAYTEVGHDFDGNRVTRIEHARVLLGAIGLKDNHMGTKNEHTALTFITVHKDFHRQGIANKMIDAMLTRNIIRNNTLLRSSPGIHCPSAFTQHLSNVLIQHNVNWAQKQHNQFCINGTVPQQLINQ